MLSKLIMELRGDKLQKDLALRLRVTSSYVSQIESGATVPKDEKLVELARVLGAEDRIPELLLWAAHDRASPDDADGKAVRQACQGLLQDLKRREAETQQRAPNRTLKHFPSAFRPLVVVTGDRREDPPKTCADVGALSGSPIDDRYLRRIPLHQKTEKISDKVFVLGEEEYLREKFSKINLLVIGSPAANHLARIVNRRALFPFAFHPTTSRDIDEIILGGKAAMQEAGSPNLKVFRDSKMADLKFIMSEFKQGGICNPLAPRRVRGRSLRDGVDFATVTIAKNPYAESDDFVAIMAAGFHLPGTVYAVKQLSDPSAFESHPLGGVVEVRMDEADWLERIEKANAEWDIEPYTVDDMLRALDELAAQQDSAEAEDEVVNAKELATLVRALQQPGESIARPEGG